MWKYISNQFIVEGARNFKKALVLNNYHLAALTKAKAENPADSDIDVMLNRYTPLAAQLATEFAKWKNLGGIKEASTLNLEQLLATLATKLNTWEPAIQVKHTKTSPAYKAILPNGRTGLTRGNKEERVLAIKNLSNALAGDTDLANIKTQVDAFYAQIEAARATQLGNKSAATKGTDEVAVAVKNAMTMQYKNLGILMDKYAENPQRIESFFDVATLQESSQTTFTGTLDPLENEAVTSAHIFGRG